MELVVQFVLFSFVLTVRRFRLGVLTRLSQHRNKSVLLVVIEGDVTQLHLAARVVYVFDSHAMIRLRHVLFGTAWRAKDLAVVLTNANVVAADFNSLVDVVFLAFELATLREQR